MANSKPTIGQIVYVSLTAVSFAIGCLIPSFYDWTGSDQSRPSPLVGQTAIGMVILAVIVYLSLPWLPITYDQPAEETQSHTRFQIRSVLLLTTAVACLISLALASLMLFGTTVCAAALCFAGWKAWNRPPYRLPIFALIACMFFPFAWILGLGKEISTTWIVFLQSTFAMPSLLPTMLTSSLARRHVEEFWWLGMLLTGLELLLGVWLIKIGPKRAIAYMIFVLLVSIVGSFGVNATIRM